MLGQISGHTSDNFWTEICPYCSDIGRTGTDFPLKLAPLVSMTVARTSPAAGYPQQGEDEPSAPRLAPSSCRHKTFLQHCKRQNLVVYQEPDCIPGVLSNSNVFCQEHSGNFMPFLQESITFEGIWVRECSFART